MSTMTLKKRLNLLKCFVLQIKADPAFILCL